MRLKTILNRIEPFKSFVYGKTRWLEDRGRPALEVEEHARKNGRAICSGCSRPGPGCDRLPERRFEFVPLWGIPFVMLDNIAEHENGRPKYRVNPDDLQAFTQQRAVTQPAPKGRPVGHRRIPVIARPHL
jgi:hypothetical protein